MGAGRRALQRASRGMPALRGSTGISPDVRRGGPLLSVVVKCLNEEANIARCLRSIAAETACRGYDAEVILADSISTDRSVEIALRFDVTIVQLADPADRRCGAAGHLGWQFARGRFLLLIDGDMELLAGFLPAAFAAMGEDGRLGAVGGGLIETSDGMEYRERQSRPDPSRRPGLVNHVTGCGLYRTAAVEDAGHFMDRNLHCFEEFELGLRLRAMGWRLRMLDTPCVRHHGHRDASVRLLVRRWRTGFLRGYGELLRGAWGRPYLREALKPCRLALATMAWWAAMLVLAAATAVSASTAALAATLAVLLAAVAVLPFAALLARKRSLERAAYSWLMLQFSAAALLAGLFSPRVAPATPLPAKVVRETTEHGAGEDGEEHDDGGRTAAAGAPRLP